MYYRDDMDDAPLTDDDLPGMWSHADFEGGDPDDRSYAEREREALLARLITTDHYHLYRNNAMFKASVDTIVGMLPLWLERLDDFGRETLMRLLPALVMGLAERGRKHDVSMAKRLRELLTQPFTDTLTREQAVNMGLKV